MTKLSDVAVVIMGQSPPGNSYNKEGRGLPLLNGAADFDGVSVRPVQYSTQPQKTSRIGDILICIRATIGNVTISDKDYCLGRGVAAIRVRDEGINPLYLSKMLEGRIERLVNSAKGSTIKGIKKNDLEALEFSFPPLETQNKTIAILKKSERLGYWRNEASKLTEDYIHSIFSEMFGDPGCNPKNWKVEKLVSVCTKITDGEHNIPPRVETGVLLVMARNVRDGYLDLSEVSYISEGNHQKSKKRCNPEKGDILLVCVGATIGRAAIVPEMDDFSLVRSVALLKPDYGCITSEYLLWCLKTNSVQAQLLAGRNTSAQSGLYLNGLKRIRIPLPPVSLQTKFSDIVTEIGRMRQMQKKSQEEIIALSGALMQKAFGGDIIC